MSGDQPPTAEPPACSSGHLRMIVTEETVVNVGDDCWCVNGEICYSLRIAQAALQDGPVSPEGILAFRRDLAKAVCKQKEAVSRAEYQKLLGYYAFLPIWGREHKKTLADAVTEELAREFGFPSDEEPAEFQHIALMHVDQGVGRLGRDVSRNGQPLVAYDPTTGTDPENRPSLWAYAKARARSDAIRAVQKGRRHRDPERPDPKLVTPRSAESEFRVLAVHHAVGEAAGLLSSNVQNELRVLDLLEESLQTAKPRGRVQEKHLRKAIEIARRIICGEPEYCIRLECEIGDSNEPQSLNLGVGLTGDVAERYGSKNTTVLKDQLTNWFRILVKHAAADADRSTEVRNRLRASLRARHFAWELLHHISPIVADLNPSKADANIRKWTGPPFRRHGAKSGDDSHVRGAGIAFLPFLFGVNGLGEALLHHFDPT